MLNDVLPDPLPLLFSNKPISYKWVGAGPTLEAQALGSLWQVRNWQDYQRTVDDWHVGAQNTVFAGVGGDIGYIASGLFPSRPWLAQHNPIEPLPATGAEWADYDAKTTLRDHYNPSWGFVASANADPEGHSVDGLFDDDYLGYAFDIGFRIHRIRDQLSKAIARGGVTMDDMLALQTDVYVGLSALLLPIFDSALTPVSGTTEGISVQATALLTSWDGMATVDRAEAALFHQTVVRLIVDNLAEPLIDAIRPLLLGNNQHAFRSLIRAMRRADAEVFPNGVDAAIRIAAKNASDDLAAFFGTTDTAQWQWGQIHTRTLNHPLGDDNPDFNRGPLPSMGGFAVVNRSDIRYINDSGQATLPYDIVDGADMRFVTELAGDDTVVKIRLPHGSSGDPNSPYYDDQFAAWVDGTYRDGLYKASDVDAGTVSTLVLK